MRIDIHRKHFTFYLMLITVTGFLCYSNTFNSPFVFDDNRNIADNPLIRDLRYFTGTPMPESSIYNAHLHQVVKFFKSRYVGYLTLAINFRLNGLDVTGYHVFNLIIHITNAMLIYWLIVLIFKTPCFSKQNGSRQCHANVPEGRYTSKTLAMVIALLFVCHPVQTQAVTYTIQRFASLATLFYLFSVVMYIQSRLLVSYSWKTICITTAILSAILAMKTKELSFTLPVVITLVEVMFFTGKFKQRCLYIIPFLLTMPIIPLTLIGSNTTLSELHDINRPFEIASMPDISRWDYLFTQFRVIVTYMRLLILPINQNLDYDYPIYRSLFIPGVLISLAFLISILGVAIFLYNLSGGPGHNSRPCLRLIAFGIFWFFVTISVESSIIPIADVIFEHRLYLPSVGAIIAIVTATTLGMSKVVIRKPSVRKFILPLVLLILTVLSIATYNRNSIWQDKVRLWSDIVKKSPAKPRPNLQLAELYTDMGYINDAMKQYQKAISLKPDSGDAHMSISRLYAYLGHYDEAISETQAGTKYYKDAYRSYYKPGETSIAFEDYFATVHFALGNTFAGWGRMEAALDEFLAAISLKPDYAQAYVSAGNVYATWGQYDEAIKKYQTALEIRPDFTDAQQNLHFVLRKKGMTK